MAEDWTRERMLAALPKVVNVWSQRVRDAGVAKSDGSAYVPLARKNAILRPPEDPGATLPYMISTWEAADANQGSDGWYRVIAQADEGPKLTWEWLMVDGEKPYAPLSPGHVRRRVVAALEREAGTSAWRRLCEQRRQAEQEQARRIAELREEYRSGNRHRPRLPELESGLRGWSRPS